MSEDIINKLLQGAVKAVKNGEKDLARRAFLEVIKRDPHNEAGLIGLATVAVDDSERRDALKRALAQNPQSPKALEAARRLGIDPQSLQDTPAPPESPEPPRPKALKSLRPAAAPAEPSTPEQPTTVAEEPAPTSAPSPVLDDETAWLPFRESAPEEEELPPVDLNALFARLAQLPQGRDGVPFAHPQRLQAGVRFVDEVLHAYETQLEQPPVQTWVRKQRRRAGEAELGVFYAQVAGVSVLTLLVVGGLLAALLLGNPEVQRVVFAPTWTPSPTPTVTPTNTPGFTPTPSVTPVLTATPSPTFPPNFATANPLLQPRLTDVYVPAGVDRGRLIVEAVQQLNDGRLQEAFTTLQEERRATELRGDFLPYYYLSEIALRQGDLTEAARWVDEGEAKWQERGGSDRYVPLITVARARITLRQIAAQSDAGATARTLQTALNDLTSALEKAIDSSSPPFVEAAVLLSERYLLEGKADDALRVLDDFANRQQELAINSVLRVQRARIYSDYLGQDENALREYETVLRFDPYNRTALRAQAELALRMGDYARADLFAEQYLARYAGSSEALRLRGDAWRGQGKFDLALNQYERALQASATNPRVRAELADVYISRAALYGQIGRQQDALDDLNEALRLSDGAPRVRFLRLQAAYRAGAFVQALNDADTLRGSTDVPADMLTLWRARILLDSGENANEAFALLDGLLKAGKLNAADTALVREYLARIYLTRSEFETALTLVTEALRERETISRRYWRARILEAQGRADTNKRDNLALARRDYEQVLLWSSVYTHPLTEDAQARYATLLR